MIITILPLISLFVSCFILMLGFGLIGILLPVRMGLEGLNTDTIGLVLSMYAVGMLLGGLYCRKLIMRVGHIRIFSASAALGAISILVCSLTMNEIVWGAMRMLMGFCIACSFAVIDGWLSDASSEKTRGRILATSQVVVMAAIFSGQFMLNIAPPTEPTLFIICGILLCLALMPLIMSRRPGPAVQDMKGMSFARLFSCSPLGVVCCFFGGIMYGGMLNMLPVYASHNGINGFELSLYMAIAILGAFVLQFPVGMLSDRYDRRTVLFFMLIVNLVATAATPFSVHYDFAFLMMLTTAISTGLFSCLYPMSISETLDKVQRSEMAAAMGGLLSIYACGSILGPSTSSIAMKWLGDDALFGFLFVSEALLLIFVLYRMRAREALPLKNQESFIMQPAVVSMTTPEIDPRVYHTGDDTPVSLEAKVAVSIAESSPGAAVNMAKEIAQTSPDKAAELCAALAQVEQIDIARLFTSITRTAPELSLEIAEALTSNSQETTTELIRWLADNEPAKLAELVSSLASQLPKATINPTEEIRPADLGAYKEAASELVSHFAEHQPEQAVDIAAAVVEQLPETASEIVDILQSTDEVTQDLSSHINSKPTI